MSAVQIKMNKSYDLYRNTPVGIAMFDAIQKLFELEKLTPNQALIIVTQFDYSIKKKMKEKQKERNNFFSFEAEVKSYRLMQDWCSVLLENVVVFQHFSPKEVQLYKHEKNQQIVQNGGKIKNFSREEYGRFKQRARCNDVKAFFQEVPFLHLICKKFCIEISPTGLSTDFKKIGKSCYVQELKGPINPRLEYFLVSPKLDKNSNVEDPNDDEIVPTPMLNRFKNSTFFSAEQDTIETEPEHYYSRKITRNPNSQEKHQFVHSFGPKIQAKKPPKPLVEPPQSSEQELPPENINRHGYVLRNRDPHGFFQKRKTL